MLYIFKRYLCVLYAQLTSFFFKTNSIIIVDLKLYNELVVAHPTMGYIDISYYLMLLNEDIKEDYVYTLVSNNGIQYELKKVIKNNEDKEEFLNHIFYNSIHSVPRYIAAIRPSDKSYFHKLIIPVGDF